MLRDWRGFGEAQLDAANIRAVRRFDMLEAFVHLFLTSVILLTQRGLARAYRTREANLPCLRGRILFPAHVRENLVDRSRFYVGYDEFTADRPANRLIHLALRRLTGVVRHPANRQRIQQLRIVFSDVPPSTNLDDDWTRHRVDRSMRHYDAVMPWVRLFLFGQGLATFAGSHVNRALLFPMEEVFEDFVTAALRRHQRQFTVCAQGPMRHPATDGAGKNAFRLKPDVVLTERGQFRFVLDAKWKHLDAAAPNHGVGQDATTLNTAVDAPMPRATVTTPTSANPRALDRLRHAYFKSCTTCSSAAPNRTSCTPFRADSSPPKVASACRRASAGGIPCAVRASVSRATWCRNSSSKSRSTRFRSTSIRKRTRQA